MENLHIPITGDSSNFRSALQSARDGVRQTAKQIEDSGMTIEQMFDRIKVAAAASLAGFSVKEFASKVMEVRGEFQKLEVAFNTMLGSAEKADALMQQLVRTAAITPFDLKGVADGAKQLMAYGIAADEVNDTLIHLGDIAAGLSLPLGDLVYLYGTTMTQGRMFTQDLRQFMGRGIPLAEELAKQFGVTKDKVGELVTAGKVGAEEFKKAIMSMSSEGGRFGGLMEEQSKTITGQISNIEDAIDVMFNNIGKQSEGIINGALSATSSLVENYETVGRVIMGLVVTYGVYKTAVMTVTALESFRTKNLALQAVGVQGVTAAEAIHYHWLVLVQKAQALLNATMLANPYVAVATAVAAVTAALISLGSEQDRVNAAYDEYMRKRDEAIAKEEEHRRKIEQLIQIAGDESLSTDTRRKALLKLEEKYPDIFKKYATEIEMLKHIRDIKAEIAILDGKTSIANPVNELAEIDKRIAELQKKGAWSLSSTNSYAGTHSSSRTRSEEEELQQKLRRRRELAKEIERDRGETYLTNLTGVSNGSLQLQINERRKLLKEIEAREKLVKKDVTVTGRVKLGGATGVYNKQEIQAQLQNLEREQERRAQIIADGSKNFVAEARKAYREQEEELKKLRALTDPKKRAESDLTIEIGGKMVKVSDMSLDQFSDAIKKQQAKVDEAEKKLKGLTGKSIASEKKTSNEVAAQRGKLFEQEMSERERQSRQLETLMDAQSAAAIAKEQNRAKRELLQAEKDHLDRLTAIDRQAEEMRKANYEAQKKAWEATNTDNTKSWADTDTAKDVAANGYKNIQLTKEQAATLKALREKENADYANLVKERFDAERQSMIDYLKEYGTYQQQRLAIAEEYSKKIAEAEASGNKWEAKRLTAERDSRIAQANAQSLAMNIDWNQTFQGVGNVLKSIAKETLDKVNDHMSTAGFKGLDAAAKKAYADLKQALIDAGGQTSSNPFSSQTWDEIADLTNQYKFHVKALADANETHTNAVNAKIKAEQKKEEAEKSLEKAIKDQAAHLGKDDQREYDKAVDEARKNLADATQGVAETLQQVQETGEAVQQEQVNVSNAQQNVRRKIDATAQGLNNFQTVVSQITSGSLKGFADGISNIIMAITGSESQMEGIAGIFGDAGKKIGGIIGAILSIIDMLGDKPVEFFDNLFDGISKVIEAVIAHIPDIIGSVVKGAGNIVGSVFSGLAGLFGIGGVDNSAYEAALDKWGGILDEWKENVEYERKLMEKAYGASAIEASRKALEAAEKAAKAATEIYQGYAASGAGLFSHSHGYDINETTNWRALVQYDSELAKRLGADVWMDENGYWHDNEAGDVSRLFGMDWKELEELKNRASQFWNSIHGDAREYLEDYIEAGRIAAETIDALNEQLTTTTKENVFSDFLSSLYDLADGAEDVTENIAEDWQKMVNRMVINNIIGKEFQEKVEAWYKKLAALQEDFSEGRINDYEYRWRTDSLMNEYNTMFDAAAAKVDDFAQRGIIKPIEEAVKPISKSLAEAIRSGIAEGTEDGLSDVEKQLMSKMREAYAQKLFNQKITVEIDEVEETFDSLDAYIENWFGRKNSLTQDIWHGLFTGPFDIDEFYKRLYKLKDDADKLKEELKDERGDFSAYDRDSDEFLFAATGLTREQYDKLKSDYEAAFDLLTELEWNGQKSTKEYMDAFAELERLQAEMDAHNITDYEFNLQAKKGDYDSVLAQIKELEDAYKNQKKAQAELDKEFEETYGSLLKRVQRYSDMVEPLLLKIEVSPLADAGETLLSSLQDSSGSIEDWIAGIMKSMAGDMIKQLVYTDEMDDAIRDLQKRYIALYETDAFGNYVKSEDEMAAGIEAIAAALEAIYADAEEKAGKIRDLIPGNSNQEATANIADKITYEQADQLLGINMAQEMTLEQILATLRGGTGLTDAVMYTTNEAGMVATARNEETGRQIESMLLGLANLNLPDGDTVREIRGLIIIGNSYLYDIKTSNEQMLRQFGERLESIDNKIGQIF